MNVGERQARIDELFERASGLSDDELARFLEVECAVDPPDIRNAVERLCRAHARTPALQPAPLPGLEQAAHVTPRDPMIGKQVGAYVLRRCLGRGGFGNVYLGERIGDYEQKAAIKLIRPEMVAEEKVLQRFELEKQALADLQHENIARLLDALG